MPDEIELTLADGQAVDALWTEAAPASGNGWTLAYAPGAGSSLADPFGRFLGEALPSAGISVLRFQFPYQQAKRRFPDRMPILEATWRSAIEFSRTKSDRLVISGRSMGGRVASYMAAQGEPIDALICFAYPLHPPGRPDKAREDELPEIQVPMLVCSGTRDVFGTPDELAHALAAAPRATLHLLEGADHSYNVLKASGRKREDVWREAADTAITWLADLN